MVRRWLQSCFDMRQKRRWTLCRGPGLRIVRNVLSTHHFAQARPPCITKTLTYASVKWRLYKVRQDAAPATETKLQNNCLNGAISERCHTPVWRYVAYLNIESCPIQRHWIPYLIFTQSAHDPIRLRKYKSSLLFTRVLRINR